MTLLEVRARSTLGTACRRDGAFQACSPVAGREGETVALVGANGAGKSTLMRVIAGRTRAAGGRIRFDGDATSTGVPAYRGSAPASRWCRRGAGCSRTLTVEENLPRCAGRPARARGRTRDGAGRVPAARPLRRQAAATPVRRRAAGARDRPGADDQPARAAARRGLARTRPGRRRGGVRVARRADRARARRSLLVEQDLARASQVADRVAACSKGASSLEGPAADLIPRADHRRLLRARQRRRRGQVPHDVGERGRAGRPRSVGCTPCSRPACR